MAEAAEVDRDLLRAVLGWKPGDRPLQEDERVQAYLRQNPDGADLVCALQFLRVLGQGMVSSGDEQTAPSPPGDTPRPG